MHVGSVFWIHQNFSVQLNSDITGQRTSSVHQETEPSPSEETFRLKDKSRHKETTQCSFGSCLVREVDSLSAFLCQQASVLLFLLLFLVYPGLWLP